MDFHYRVERLQFAACLPDAAKTKGAPTSCLFFFPCSFFSTSLPSLCQAPPSSLHPSSPSRSPPPQSQAGTCSLTPQHQLQKGGFFPSSPDSLGGGGGDSKARNMYTTACFIITSFLGPSYFPNNQQLKLIALSSSSPGKKKSKVPWCGNPWKESTFYVIFSEGWVFELSPQHCSSSFLQNSCP